MTYLFCAVFFFAGSVFGALVMALAIVADDDRNNGRK